MAESGKYPGLGDLAQAGKIARTAKICIVTPDLVGPVKNGGIGTACANLALALADAGNGVSVLFTGLMPDGGPDWQLAYEKRGIQVATLDTDYDETAFWPAVPQAVYSKRIYDWLREQEDFDLVLFMDWQANGFYSVHAKKTGQYFSNTQLVVALHSPSMWHALHNGYLTGEAVESCLWHMERQCVELADAVISPSAYMLDWCAAHGWRLPGQRFVQPNILLREKDPAPAMRGRLDEVVFFGRLEYRKGLAQFCNALDRLASQNRLPARITFLGKFSKMGSEHSLVYIARRARAWQKSEIKFLADYSSKQATDYLKSGSALAVIPSTADNSPYTVYECLAQNIPMLCRDCGGISELVHPDGRDSILFGDTPQELAERIVASLEAGQTAGKLAFDPERNRADWIAGLTALASGNTGTENLQELPRISVCLTHHDRSDLLQQAVQSLMEQDYQDFEVILVDDGSEMPESQKALADLEDSFADRDWKIIRSENRFVGHARNLAASKASGSWLLFFDDDNIAKPGLIRHAAQAASRCDRGLVTFMFDVFSGAGEPEQAKERFLPTGGAIAYSAIHNAISDATALVSKESFQNSGGFTEDYGLSHEDYELYLRMALSGEPVYVIPVPLFWYRRQEEPGSVLSLSNSAANRMRSLRPFMELLPPQLAELALMTHAMSVKSGFFSSGGCVVPEDLDPNCGRALEDIMRWMDESGNNLLKDQVQNLIAFREYGHLIDGLEGKLAACVKIAKMGDRRLLAQEIEKLASELGGEKKSAFIADLGEMLLRNLPEQGVSRELRKYIVRLIEKTPHAGLSRDLVLAVELLPHNAAAACRHFISALDKSEQEYLRQRPDVADAVANRRLLSGLQHYAFHGRHEGMRWPDHDRYIQALTRYKERIGDLATHYAAIKGVDRNFALSALKGLLA